MEKELSSDLLIAYFISHSHIFNAVHNYVIYLQLHNKIKARGGGMKTKETVWAKSELSLELYINSLCDPTNRDTGTSSCQ